MGDLGQNPRCAARHLDFLHPLVPAAYLMGTLAITMLFMQPIIVALSLIGALSCSFAARGTQATCRGLIWQLPLVALVSLVNPFFSASGSTLLCKLGLLSVYLESLAYGACAGALLVASVVWLECLAALVNEDGLYTLGASAFPVATLAISMCARLVPELMARAQEIESAQSACTASERPSNAAARAVATSTSLLTWAMEDSLVRVDSMRARGWGAATQRSSFRPRRIALRDLCALAISAVALIGAGFLAWVAWSQWSFYPTMPQLVAWWGYLPLAVLFFVPACVLACGRLLWR